MSQQQQIILHLSLIPGVGPVTIQKIVQHCSNQKSSLLDLYQLHTRDFCSFGFSQALAQAVVTGLNDFQILEQELNLLYKYNIQITTIISDNYPALLKNIYVPPSVLYIRGLALNLYEKNLAIIGSRNGSHYAQSVIDTLVPVLGEYGWSIVSGGAIGVDTMAHLSALRCHTPTISVLGSGLLCPYPRENKSLFEKIVGHGTVISQFPLHTGPTRGNFPARNRVIAGLSRGVLVVQAGKRSGAHITARYALDQGKEIFAVPGSYNDPLSDGCHKLIQDGAKLVRAPSDILQEFGEGCQDENIVQIACKLSMDPIKQKILLLCRQAASLDDIVEQIQLSADEAYEHIFDLQVKGLIEQNFMGLFQVAHS